MSEKKFSLFIQWFKNSEAQLVEKNMNEQWANIRLNAMCDRWKSAHDIWIEEQ